MGKEKEEIKKTKGNITFLLVFLIAGVLAVAQILVANRLATQGDLIEKYEIEARWLNEENQRMENQIIGLSSLSEIASRSGKLAFKKGIPVFYLPRPIVVAMGEK